MTFNALLAVAQTFRGGAVNERHDNLCSSVRYRIKMMSTDSVSNDPPYPAWCAK